MAAPRNQYSGALNKTSFVKSLLSSARSEQVLDGRKVIACRRGKGAGFSYNPGGYARVNYDGKVLVHVIVLTEVQGPAPEGRADASHLCGNPWCFEPKHLWWENRANNIARRGCAGRVLAGDRWIRVCQHTPECKVTTSGVVCDEDDIPSP
jgi:hypothetical protein